MSLNGLDSPSVVEAYQNALADAGGWFLLHYTARDEVALLDRGTGGVPDVRNAVDHYDECSPLYGFLHYRRRKVILRYMPEGLSRLILGMNSIGRPMIGRASLTETSLTTARSNVQFQSILDRFTPHDTVLPIASVSDLNESALSSACLLHTASGSALSASNSVRGRRLMEITEDVEENVPREEREGQSGVDRVSQVQRPSPSLQITESQQPEATLVPLPSTPSHHVEISSPDLPVPPSRASSRSPLSYRNPEDSHERTPSPMSPRSPGSTTSERPRYQNILDEFPRPSDDIRMSSQSARPSLRELERAAGHAHKVKLGPRPVVDASGRPRTSGSSRTNPDQRPVAPMPAGLRSSSVRKPSPSVPDVPRPRSQGSAFATKPSSRAPPVPPLLVPPASAPLSRPPLSPGAKSLGALSTSSGLTPEKERLMKALQQRKRQMAKRAEQTKHKAEGQEHMATSTSADSVGEKKLTSSQGWGASEGPPSSVQNDSNATQVISIYVDRDITTSHLAPTGSPSAVIDEPPVRPGGTTSAMSTESQSPPEGAPPQPSVPMDIVEARTDMASSPVVSSDDPALNRETPVSDADCHSLGKSGPSADTTCSADRAEMPPDITKAASRMSPEIEVSEPEARAEHTESTLSGPIDAQGDRVPPSAHVEVPLTEEAANIPTPTPALEQTSPVQPPTIVPVLNRDQRDENSAEAGLAQVDRTNHPDLLLVVEPCSNPTVAPVEVSVEPVWQDQNQHASEEQLNSTTTLTSTATATPTVPPLNHRRKNYLEPIHVSAQEFSDEDGLLSDDSFMEELRSATVEEARPVSVKSPNGGDQPWKGPRAASGPHIPSTSAGQPLMVGRSASSSHVERGLPTPVLVAKKINVSSGISSRIKALEKFSSREGTPSGSNLVPGPSASSSFEELRKRASIQVPHGTTLPDFSRAPSVNHHDARPVSAAAHRRTTSISVTARIVRDSSASPDSSGVEPSESEVLNLQPSALTVEQHEVLDTESPDLTAPEPPTAAVPVEARTMSMSSAGSYFQPSPVSRPASRLSISSRSKTEENVISVSPPDEKKGSRASRLMRRVSSITSTSRRNIIGALSSPVKEEHAAVSPPEETVISASSSRQTLSEPIDIGEVNVQFPGTLLWKRRFMRIDGDGYVVFTPGTHDTSARNMVKRYHLSEVRAPCLPDEDMQELPNSILLDFLDGSSLQCACESRQGQAWTLQTLRDAHSTYQQ
ncbi:hypothetical protein PDE_07469 [Penicillium oxalicum 114-2]|uniref:ADF-H domain-containing protein n=1 Tax=Penicillium oxalicum (strain 114-2 / CGMCC 5302) TaxID=933388 RepID=S7ZQ28_PENO1|nr:hypothetical protein PDE_07469 [Penicillium oxalicum 114-2]